MRIDRIALVFASLAAISCAKVSVVGTSGEPADAQVQSHAPDASQIPSGQVGKPAHKGPKYTSTITPPSGAIMGFDQPILGDVDGDGLDDFLVLGSYLPESDPASDAVAPEFVSHAYLFYGKAQLAMNLSTDDADAAFEADTLGVWAVGDVNGDGLADFAIGHVRGYELVFGSTTRYSGSIAASSVGRTLVADPLPPPVAPNSVAPINAVRGAGDIDGDGVDDIIVTATSFEPQLQLESTNFGLTETDYLLLGNRGPGEWGSDMWDPSSAAAAFGVEDVVDAGGSHHRRKLRTLAAGDLDGDGNADIVGLGGSSVYVFYGGPGKLTGTLDADAADAIFVDLDKMKAKFEIDLQPHSLFAIGDLDGDGASDLALISDDSLGVVYGPKSRWSGSTQLTPEFVVDFASQNHVRTFAAAESGDIDGDGASELVVMTQSDPPDGAGQALTALIETLFIIRGAHERALGTHRVDVSDVHPLPTDHTLTWPIGAMFTNSVQPGTLLSLAGDIDGDGSCDIITGHPGGLNGELPQPVVYVIPSTPNTPD